MAGVYNPRDPYRPYHGPAQVNPPTQPPRLPSSGKRLRRVAPPEDTDDLVWPNATPNAPTDAYTVPDMAPVPPPRAAPPARPPARNRRGGIPIPFHSRALRWIALSVVVAIVGVIAYAWVAAQRNGSPTGTVDSFCGALRADNFTQAYNLLGSAPRARITSADFATAAAALDRIEGRVTACPTTPSSAVQTGINAATVDASLQRAGLGQMRGRIALSHEQNAWRITTLDATLLGVNLDALVAADGYCAGLLAQRYTETYNTLTDEFRGDLTSAEYEQMSQWRDLIDGAIRSCAPVTVDSSGGDNAATLTFNMSRAKLGRLRGDIALVNTNGAWKVQSVAASLQGTDLGALVTGRRYCADLASNNSGDLATQVTAGYWLNNLLAYAAAGIKGESWTGCSFDAATFKLDGGKASYKGVMQITAKDKTTRRAALTFGLIQSDGAWKMDTLSWQ
jgi:hypothetical protein